MIIPKGKQARLDFVQDIIKNCMASQQERLARYELWKKFYDFGADDGMSDYNKIDVHIDKVTSYIYEPGAVRFDISLPVIAGQAEEAMASMTDRMTREFNRLWHADAHDLAMMDTTTWGLVYGAMPGKVLWTRKVSGPGVEIYPFDPYLLGVLREDITDIHRQEAICHQFFFSADELWRILKLRHDGLKTFKRITFGPSQDEGMSANTLNTLVITATQPSYVQGVAPPDTRIPAGMFKAVNTAPLAQAYELWLWDDEEDDFRVVTMVEPDVVIFDRKNFVLPRVGREMGRHPFFLNTPNPMKGYIWGRSEVYGLIGLQQWNDQRLRQIRKLQDLQVDPPTAYTGDFSLTDEINSALSDPGSWVQSDMPGAKVEKLAPEMPQDIFEEVRGISEFFRDRAGLSEILEGKGTQGVRGSEHAALLAQLGGSRIKKKALAAEEALTDAANIKWRLMQRYDPHRMKTSQGMVFAADAVSDDALLSVDNHSQAPVFSGGHMEEAAILFKAGGIDAEDFIEISKLPGKERLKQKVRTRNAQKQEMFKMLLKANPSMANTQAKGILKGM